MPKSVSNTEPVQPHDGLFKFAFAQREHAVGLLRAVLPQDVIAAIAWDSVSLEQGTFVDPALRRRHTDLLFSARIADGKAFLYTLIEHQRSVDPLMIFRGGVYLMRAWEHMVRETPQRSQLPPIVLIVVHNGGARGWTAATAFEELVAAPEPARTALRPFIPHFRMRLVDLSPGQASGLADQALTAMGEVVLWCLSVAGDTERFRRELGTIQGALDAMLAAPNAMDALLAMVRYLRVTQPALDPFEMVKLLEDSVSPEEKAMVVDVLDVFKVRGREEGRAKMLLAQLKARFGAVPADVKARILDAKEPALARWSLRVLTAPSLAEVMDGKAKASPAKRTPARKTSKVPR